MQLCINCAKFQQQLKQCVLKKDNLELLKTQIFDELKYSVL